MFKGLALAVALVSSSPAALPAPQRLPTLALRVPRARLVLQVARTEPQRERGLMSVRYLPAHTGMIFVFESDAPIEFWMKDTLVPLDMVFVGGNGVVRSVFARVPVVPTDTPDKDIPRRDGVAKYVLELPAGEASRDGISAGLRVSGLPI